jgi:hypothetical protein
VHKKKPSSHFAASFDFIDWAMKMNFSCIVIYFKLKIALFAENGEKLISCETAKKLKVPE